MFFNSIIYPHSMTNSPLPTIDSVESLASIVMASSDVNNDKRISLSEFICYVTKNKDFLRLLNCYSLITKDDLRPNFGWTADDLPDCDSDLENEVLRKGAEKCSVDYELLQHPVVEVFLIFSPFILCTAVTRYE